MIRILNALIFQWFFVRLVILSKDQMFLNTGRKAKGLMIQGFVMPITNKKLGKTWNAGFGWGK